MSSQGISAVDRQGDSAVRAGSSSVDKPYQQPGLHSGPL